MLVAKLIRSFKKNLPEVEAFASGKMPQFIYGKRAFHDIPNFCFHEVEAIRFEEQLGFLRENGYVTLDAAELESRLLDPEYRNSGKEIILTFDDGLSSLWHVAFPLLKKYGFKAISFILPGLIEKGEPVTGDGPTDPEPFLKTTWVSLCTWTQIECMHRSGVIDFQSHGLYHPLISISKEIVDFIGTETGIYYFGNSQIPFYGDGTEAGDSRKNVPGHPIYKSASLYSGALRYFDDLRVRDVCEKWVADHGGSGFFSKSDWKKELRGICESFSRKNNSGSRYQTREERDEALLFELSESKSRIERQLPGKSVRHFCNPWYIGSEVMARRAKEAGYSALHLGATQGFSCRQTDDYPLFILRIQEEYLMMLPGKGRKGFYNTLKRKFASSPAFRVSRARLGAD